MVKLRKSERLSKPQEKVRFWRAVGNFFKNAFRFDGTATRAEYWWMFAFWGLGLVVLVCGIFLAALIASLIKVPLNVPFVTTTILCIFAASFILMAVPWYALMSRRLHDAGFSAKLLWICAILMILRLILPWTRGIMWIDWVAWAYSLFLYVLFLLPSKFQNNRYRN